MDEKAVSQLYDMHADELTGPQFEPVNRHSVHDPIDLISPTVPNVGGLTPTGEHPNPLSPRVDPFPYGAAAAGAAGAGAGAASMGAYNNPQAAYDPYGHPTMHMPDANDYAVNSGGGYGYGPHDGGYGVAAGMGAGAAAVGAGAAGYGASRGYGDPRSPTASAPSQYSASSTGGNQTSPPPLPALGAPAGMSAAALAKQREAANQSQRSRMSAYSGGSPQQTSGPSGHARQGSVDNTVTEENATSPDVRRSGSGSVFQHTDYGSVTEGNDEDEAEAPAEVPPK